MSEPSVRQCSKCDCLLPEVPEESDQCLNKSKYSSDDDDEEVITLKHKSNETVKIYVEGVCKEDHCLEKASRRTSSVQRESEPKKSSCIPWCRKKTKDEEKDKKHVTLGCQCDRQDFRREKTSCTQTRTQCMNDSKTQSSEMNLGEILKNCTHGGKFPGGCNTNTIIFPRDKSSGDGLSSLEHWLKLEAKSNSRNLEDILSELHKQRREIHELKDMLDTVVRAVREQLFMTAFGKKKSEMIDDRNRKKSLERKNNSLSMVTPIEPEIKKRIVSKELLQSVPEEKKKKKHFSWFKFL